MNVLTSLNWTQPSWDLFIVLFFVVAAFLYGLSLGRDRIITILVSIYMALAITSNAPYLTSFTATISINNGSIFKVSVFLGMFVILFFLLSRSALIHTIASDAPGKWWHAIVFSFFHVGLMLSITLGYLPKDIVNYISEGMRNLFISEQAKFFWLVTPVVMMALVRREQKTA